MNKHVKNFLHRGMMFGGFGPIVAGIVYLFLKDISIDGKEVFVAIISTYLLAFIHAGVSVFNQIEEWSTAKSLLCHLSSLYVIYIVCYLINSWIPFDFKVILIFTVAFILLYLLIWFCVFVAVKSTEKRLNSKLK